MNILLFGGSFNPPHLGHEIVIRQAFELIPTIDELWLLPTYNHAFGKDLAPAPHRLAMCHLLKNSLGRQFADIVKVCPIEIDYQTNGSTYHTLQLLKRENEPSNYRTIEKTFSFLMGSDQLPTFDKWEHYQQLLEQMPFYIYPRGSHRYHVTYQNMTLLESPTQIITNISSTLVRDRLKNHLPVDHIIPTNIAEYITNHGLYHL